MKVQRECRYLDTGLNGLILLLLCVAVSLSAMRPTRSWAEIYRWQDENGYWHFTEGPAPESPTTQHEPAPSKRGQLPEDTGTANYIPPEKSIHGGLLWRINSGDQKVSYLLGTIHSEDPRVTRLKPPVAKALNASDRFVMEMILDTQAFMQFGAAMVLDQNTDLEKLVGKNMYGRVVSAMADYGMPEPAVRRLKPWVVIAMLSMPKSGGGQILDMALYQRATSQGKPASGLESAKEQLAVFEGLTVQDQIELLDMTLKQLPQQQRMFEQLIEAYAADDLDRIADIAKLSQELQPSASARKFMVRLNDDRNLRMVKRIIPYLDMGNTFIAVGALHLAGPRGILALLRKRGYTAESVH